MSVAGTRLPPVVKVLDVPWTPEAAFRRFTEEISSWWPMASHSVGQTRTRTVVFEPRVGGTVHEVLDDGTTHVWGTITAFEPPGRAAFTWHPGRPVESAGDIEVTFVARDGGTRMTLTHGGWERFGRGASVARRGYNLGWDWVLSRWTERPAPLLASAVQSLGRVIQVAARAVKRT